METIHVCIQNVLRAGFGYDNAHMNLLDPTELEVFLCKKTFKSCK